MREAQAHAAKRAKESHLRNGTYPPKGWYSPNLQKGQQYRFKRKEADVQTEADNETGLRQSISLTN